MFIIYLYLLYNYYYIYFEVFLKQLLFPLTELYDYLFIICFSTLSLFIYLLTFESFLKTFLHKNKLKPKIFKFNFDSNKTTYE